MSTAAIVPIDKNLDAIEQALIRGNIGELNQQQRLSYYQQLCSSLGLNPLTQPFEYLTLNGKVRLYAKKDATDQLRKIHHVSVISMETQKVEDVHIVVVRVRDKEGREDIGTGAVPFGNLKGEALANALMKGETKAKRRATLSICGLGFLDETEIETIPRHEQFEARNYEVNESTPAKCDKCSKDIVDIKNPEPSKGKFATLSAAQAIAYSEKTYDASWCWDCIIAEKRAKVDENGQNGSTTAPIANKTNEVSRSTTPSDDVTPDPLFTEFDGKLLVSGTVTEIKPGASFALFMGKERFSTFSASTAEILKDSLGKRVILEYKTNEKGGKTYKNIFDVRNIGGVDYDNGVPCTDVNADLYVTEEDTKEPF